MTHVLYTSLIMLILFEARLGQTVPFKITGMMSWPNNT